MSETPIRDVADTSIWVAYHRSLEGKRPDAIVSDPFAERLAGAEGAEIARRLGRDRILPWIMAVRTRVIDELLGQLLPQGVDTVINLGAGLDARPYRLDLPASLRWVEIDHPRILELKKDRLRGERPRCRLEPVALDLANLEARRALFSRIGRESQKTLLLTEGVLPYLTPEQVRSLAQDLRAQVSFRIWIADYFSDPAMKHMTKVRRSTLRNAPFRFTPPSYQPFFLEAGWRMADIRYLGVEGEKWGRPFPAPFFLRPFAKLFGRTRAGEAVKRFAGYAVLAPA